MKVPYVDLPAQHAALTDALVAAFTGVLRHGQFILGPEVDALERRVAGILGARPVVAVGSGAAALSLALRLRGIGPGDEVLTVSHSFVATASAIRSVGAVPVFVDVAEDTMLMSAAGLAAARTPRTRAVLPVHLNGHPCDMDAIGAFCSAHGLVLVEDCAQALGATWRGQAVGTFGVGAFSFHPLKVLSACGDAGFVAVPDDGDALELWCLRNNGLRDRDTVVEVSDHSRLDTLQAALLLVKLDHLDAWIAARRVRAERYRQALAGRVVLPPEDGPGAGVYGTFVIRHPERDRVQAALAAGGVDARVHYPRAIHQQPAFAGCATAPLPVTERVVSEILSLPVSPELTEAQQAHVIAVLLAALGAGGA